MPDNVKVRYQYPGDPPAEAELMFGQQFREAFKFYTDSGTYRRLAARHPFPDDVVLCDTCNADIGPHDPCALARRDEYLYCWTCYGAWIRPYLLP